MNDKELFEEFVIYINYFQRDNKINNDKMMEILRKYFYWKYRLEKQ